MVFCLLISRNPFCIFRNFDKLHTILCDCYIHSRTRYVASMQRAWKKIQCIATYSKWPTIYLRGLRNGALIYIFTKLLNWFHLSRALLGCGGNMFSCDSGECIMTSKVCDGNSDCSDFSDEMNCIIHGMKLVNILFCCCFVVVVVVFWSPPPENEANEGVGARKIYGYYNRFQDV